MELRQQEVDEDDVPLVEIFIDEKGETVRVPCVEAVENGKGSEALGRKLRTEGKTCWFYPPAAGRPSAGRSSVSRGRSGGPACPGVRACWSAHPWRRCHRSVE